MAGLTSLQLHADAARAFATVTIHNLGKQSEP